MVASGFFGVVLLLVVSEPPVLMQLEPASVERVVDGDTLYLAGEKRRIRLFGVDAPERGEPGFDAARADLERLVADERLRCDVVAIDRYDRPVARCRLDDGREINRALIGTPHVREYCRFSGGLYGGCAGTGGR